MRISMACAALLASGLAAFAGDVSKPMPKAKAVDLMQRVCFSLCLHRDQACIRAVPRPARCETDAVVCQSSCNPCVETVGTCLDGKDATVDACEPRFVACMKKALTSRPAEAKPIRFEGGDGHSQSAAVVISGARNEIEGIVAESVWTSRAHPTWAKQDQALFHDGARSYDRIGYAAPDGRHEAWFDITGFFGKL